LIDVDNFCTVGNRNEYSTKQVQTMSLQPNYCMAPLYPIKLKIAQKQPAAYCTAFCWTDCYKLSQKV